MTTGQDEHDDRFTQFFTQVFEGQNLRSLEKILDSEATAYAAEQLRTPPSERVCAAIGSLSVGKTSGHEPISTELKNAASDAFVRMLSDLFKKYGASHISQEGTWGFLGGGLQTRVGKG